MKEQCNTRLTQCDLFGLWFAAGVALLQSCASCHLSAFCALFCLFSCLRGAADCLQHAAVLPVHPHCGPVSLHPAVQPRHLLRRHGSEQRSPAALLRLAGAVPFLLLLASLGGSGRRQSHLATPLPHDGCAGRAGRGHQHHTHPGALPSWPLWLLVQQPPNHACTGGGLHPLPALGCAGRPAVDQQLQLSLRLTTHAAPTPSQGTLGCKVKGPLGGRGLSGAGRGRRGNQGELMLWGETVCCPCMCSPPAFKLRMFISSSIMVLCANAGKSMSSSTHKLFDSH